MIQFAMYAPQDSQVSSRRPCVRDLCHHLPYTSHPKRCLPQNHDLPFRFHPRLIAKFSLPRLASARDGRAFNLHDRTSVLPLLRDESLVAMGMTRPAPINHHHVTDQLNPHLWPFTPRVQRHRVLVRVMSVLRHPLHPQHQKARPHPGETTVCPAPLILRRL